MPTFINIPLKNITIGNTAKDLGAEESRKDGMRAICAALGVPSRIANDPDGSTYSNRLEDEKAIWSNGLEYDLNELADGLTQFLCKPVTDYEDLYFEYDFSEIEALQENIEKKVDWMNKAYYTPNEIRVATGMEPIDLPIMNEPIFTNSVKPLGQVDTSVDYRRLSGRRLNNV